ncbi:MAG TPA: hypothetical protein VFE85_02310 [Woeseiaceae bacterium]|nr:hypothetical protein [Woeseiaceae bacterium]
MSEISTMLDTLESTLAGVLDAFVAYLPALAAALLLVIAGWLAARLLRAAAVRLGGGLNALLLRFGRRDPAARRLQLSPAVLALLGNVTFWLTNLLFVTFAARVAGLQLFTAWLYQVVAWLPTLLAGGLIVLAGFLVSTLVRDIVSAALESAGSHQGNFFGLLAQSAVFLAALVIGLDQVGIDVTFITILFGIVTGGLLFGIALAFGLGAREFVGNLIGAHHVREQLGIGQHVRIADQEGEIVEFTVTAVVMSTDAGRLSIPARHFQEQAALIVAADDHE